MTLSLSPIRNQFSTYSSCFGSTPGWRAVPAGVIETVYCWSSAPTCLQHGCAHGSKQKWRPWTAWEPRRGGPLRRAAAQRVGVGGGVLPEGAGTPRQHDYKPWLGALQPSQMEERRPNLSAHLPHWVCCPMSHVFLSLFSFFSLFLQHNTEFDGVSPSWCLDQTTDSR